MKSDPTRPLASFGEDTGQRRDLSRIRKEDVVQYETTTLLYHAACHVPRPRTISGAAIASIPPANRASAHRIRNGYGNGKRQRYLAHPSEKRRAGHSPSCPGSGLRGSRVALIRYKPDCWDVGCGYDLRNRRASYSVRPLPRLENGPSQPTL